MQCEKFEKLDILIDNPSSWMWGYIGQIEEICKKYSKNIRIFKQALEIESGDIMFILGCDRIPKKELLEPHKHNIVIHESDLPLGKGWSSPGWQADDGFGEIHIAMFEASEELDIGDRYIKDVIILDGFELINEIRCKQACKSMQMIERYLSSYPLMTNKQIGESTFFPKRSAKDRGLDIERSIKEQFDKLRVCDNEQHPAHFFVDMGGAESKSLFSKFTKLRSEYVYMVYLDFDTKLFAKPSFVMDLSRSHFEPNELIREEFKDYFKNAFVAVKANMDCPHSKTIFLESCGFYFVDTEMILQHKEPKYIDSDVEVFEISDIGDLDIGAFDGVFSGSRFHLDANISNELADRLWIEYLENFQIDTNNKIFVARCDGVDVGYIGVHIFGGEATLFAVATRKEYQGKSIGSKMIQSIVGSLKSSMVTNVKTEVYTKNIAAVNFYIKNGFSKIAESRYVLHKY